MKQYYSQNRRRRQLQVRRKICLLAASIAVFVLLSVSAISISTQASGLESAESHKYYRSIQIAKGDTLWSIAKENMDTHHYDNVYEYISEIKTMNSIKSDHIVSGSYIIIPYYY
ncbi:MAG: LysM peptidoglycan-binding domain-containing protein [Lachnospiraceae bacterium]|nr:LysM peptidoglycan-binding domain-containing protein [Lachnospiraceae bacterium]